MELTPAKWPVEFVLISNDTGREAYLNNDRIHMILAPAIQATCRLTPEETTCFPPPLYPRHTTSPRLTVCPSRSLPHIPVVGTHTPQRGPSTPPQKQGPVPSNHTASPCPATTYLATGSTSLEGYTSSQALPKIATMPPLTGAYTLHHPPMGEPPPVPHQWTPKYIPENWIYTDGSDIKGYPRLGAAVVHVPTATTIYIDADVKEETRSIMRVELVSIHTALTTFVAHEWIGIFTDSLSSLGLLFTVRSRTQALNGTQPCHSSKRVVVLLRSWASPWYATLLFTAYQCVTRYRRRLQYSTL